jgi:hypothetical protein
MAVSKKIKYPKFYTQEQVMAKFEKKSDKVKVKILLKAIEDVDEGGGSKEYCIFKTMGYGMSDWYDDQQRPMYEFSKD